MKIEFEGEIEVTQDDLDAADGDVDQAVQNLIGSTGAVVLEADWPYRPIPPVVEREPPFQLGDQGKKP